MKYFITSIIFILLLNSCNLNSDGSIGNEISDGKFELNEKVKDSITLDWNQSLRANKLNSSISELRVVKEKDLKTNIEYYSILGKTNDDLAKIRTEIECKNKKLYFSKSEISTIVICHGSSNCFPRLDNGKWFCDDGTKLPSCSLDCQKSVISIIKD